MSQPIRRVSHLLFAKIKGNDTIQKFLSETIKGQRELNLIKKTLKYYSVEARLTTMQKECNKQK